MPQFAVNTMHEFQHIFKQENVEYSGPWTVGNRIFTVKVPNSMGFPELHEEENKMSSLSRRACYKCGNVGHYAEVCSSSERLCYNCKQPGHESNNCPHPRTTEGMSNSWTAHGQGSY